MKISIEAEERFPEFIIVDDAPKIELRIEVPDEMILRWKLACAEFNRCQQEMKQFYTKANKYTA